MTGEPGPLRWVFDGGRGAMLDEHDAIVGYWTPPGRVSPPPGWFVFGAHTEWNGPVEFSAETDEGGMPLWERPRDLPTAGTVVSVPQGGRVLAVAQVVLYADGDGTERVVADATDADGAPLDMLRALGLLDVGRGYVLRDAEDGTPGA